MHQLISLLLARRENVIGDIGVADLHAFTGEKLFLCAVSRQRVVNPPSIVIRNGQRTQRQKGTCSHHSGSDGKHAWMSHWVILV